MGLKVKTPLRVEVHPVAGSVTFTLAVTERYRSPSGSGVGSGGTGLPFSSQVSVSMTEFGIEGDRTEIELPVEDSTFPAKDVPAMTKSTIIEDPKFTPVTVTRVLPPCGPPNGETLKIDGRGIL